MVAAAFQSQLCRYDVEFDRDIPWEFQREINAAYGVPEREVRAQLVKIERYITGWKRLNFTAR